MGGETPAPSRPKVDRQSLCQLLGRKHEGPELTSMMLLPGILFHVEVLKDVAIGKAYSQRLKHNPAVKMAENVQSWTVKGSV